MKRTVGAISPAMSDPLAQVIALLKPRIDFKPCSLWLGTARFGRHGMLPQAMESCGFRRLPKAGIKNRFRYAPGARPAVRLNSRRKKAGSS